MLKKLGNSLEVPFVYWVDVAHFLTGILKFKRPLFLRQILLLLHVVDVGIFLCIVDVQTKKRFLEQNKTFNKAKANE